MLEILRFGVLILGDTVDEWEEEVGEEVEGDETDEQPVRLGTRQLRLLQVNGEEYAHDPQDLGRVSCTAATTFIPVFKYPMIRSRQPRLLQVNSEEYAHDTKDLGHVSCKATTTFITVLARSKCTRCPGSRTRFLQSNDDLNFD